MLSAAVLACCMGLVHPVTLEKLIAVESGGDPLAVHANHNGTTDYGLTQINQAWLPIFGLTPQQVMEPCSNVRVGCTILASNYAAALRRFGPGEFSVRAALSAYNTGSFYAGQATYVPKFYGDVKTAAPVVQVRSVPSTSRVNPYTADTQVFLSDLGQ